VAAKLYARQKYEKVKEKLEKGDVEGGLEGDLAYIIGMIRTKVDSKGANTSEVGRGHFVVAAHTQRHDNEDFARPVSEAEG